MIDKFCDNYIHRLNAKKILYVSVLSNGSIKTMEDYRLTIGKLKGLEEAENLLRELFKDTFNGNFLGESREGNSYEDGKYT